MERSFGLSECFLGIDRLIKNLKVKLAVVMFEHDWETWLQDFFFVCVASLVLLGLKYQDNETGLIHVGFWIRGIVIYAEQGGQ